MGPLSVGVLVVVNLLLWGAAIGYGYDHGKLVWREERGIPSESSGFEDLMGYFGFAGVMIFSTIFNIVLMIVFANMAMWFEVVIAIFAMAGVFVCYQISSHVTYHRTRYHEEVDNNSDYPLEHRSDGLPV